MYDGLSGAANVMAGRSHYIRDGLVRKPWCKPAPPIAIPSLISSRFSAGCAKPVPHSTRTPSPPILGGPTHRGPGQKVFQNPGNTAILTKSAPKHGKYVDFGKLKTAPYNGKYGESTIWDIVKCIGRTRPFLPRGRISNSNFAHFGRVS